MSELHHSSKSSAHISTSNKHHYTWFSIITLFLVYMGLSFSPSNAVADGDNLTADEYCAYAVKARLHNEDVTTVCKLYKKATEVDGNSACHGDASYYLEANACRYINTSGVRSLIISIDQRRLAQKNVDDLCALAVKAKIHKDNSAMCDYFSRAIKEGGNEACKGHAWEMIQSDKCNPASIQAIQHVNSSNETPQNKKSAVAQNLAPAPSLNVEEYCALAVKAKIQLDGRNMCKYYRKAIELDGEGACNGKAREDIQFASCPEVPMSETPDAKNTTELLSADEFCSLAVKAKLNKDTNLMCQYYNQAVDLDGREACSGAALESLKEANCLNVVVKNSPQKSTSPKKNEPVKTDNYSIEELCTLGVKAKLQKDTNAMCHYYKKAISLEGENACAGRALPAIGICK